MKIGKMVFAATFAIGLGSSGAYAQTATFTAVVSQVDLSAGTISLTQALPPKPGASADTVAPTATADYTASPVLLAQATVGTTVQATVQRVNGYLAVTTLQTPSGSFSALPVPAAGAIPALTSIVGPAPVVLTNPASLTPAGIP